MGIEAGEGDVVNGAAGAGEEDVEEGEGAGEAVVLEIGPHFPGDEEAEVEEAVEGLAEGDEGCGEGGGGEGLDLREGADGLDAAEDVGGGLGEEGVSVEEVGAAEEVEEGAGVGVVMAEGGGSPCLDGLELVFVELGPGLVEIGGMLGPCGGVGEGLEGGAGDGEAGEEAGFVVWGGCGGTEGRKDQDEEEEQRELVPEAGHGAGRVMDGLDGSARFFNQGGCGAGGR